LITLEVMTPYDLSLRLMQRREELGMTGEQFSALLGLPRSSLTTMVNEVRRGKRVFAGKTVARFRKVFPDLATDEEWDSYYATYADYMLRRWTVYEQRNALFTLIKRLEWSHYGSCPICKADQTSGHAKYCEIQESLVRVEQAMAEQHIVRKDTYL
jgi:hypothetical protein